MRVESAYMCLLLLTAQGVEPATVVLKLDCHKTA